MVSMSLLKIMTPDSHSYRHQQKLKMLRSFQHHAPTSSIVKMCSRQNLPLEICFGISWSLSSTLHNEKIRQSNKKSCHMSQAYTRLESAFYRRANRTEFRSYCASWLKQPNRNGGYLSEMQLFYTNHQSYFELISSLMPLEEMEESVYLQI